MATALGSYRRVAFAAGKVYRDADGGGFEAANANSPTDITSAFTKVEVAAPAPAVAPHDSKDDKNGKDEKGGRSLKMSEAEMVSIEVLLRNTKEAMQLVDPAAEAALQAAKEKAAKEGPAPHEDKTADPKAGSATTGAKK